MLRDAKEAAKRAEARAETIMREKHGAERPKAKKRKAR